jgi:predicted ATPase
VNMWELDIELLAFIRDELALLYPTINDSLRVVSDAGMDPRDIAFDAKARMNWFQILERARFENHLQAVLRVALKEYPDAQLADLLASRYGSLNAALEAIEEDPHGSTRYYTPLSLDTELARRLRRLPPQPTELVGRDEQVSEVADLLRSPRVRLITLTGSGGIGKTRLALEIAVRVLDMFADDPVFVDLTTVRLSTRVVEDAVHCIIRGLGLSTTEDSLEAIERHFRDKNMLLILDNFEQMLGGCDDADVSILIQHLVAKCSRLKILVTSRQILNLRGERVVVVEPLATPPQSELPTARIKEYPAIQLFQQRARDKDPSFEISDENAADVASICICLAGIPLAIELAAARVRTLSPAEILERLNARLPLPGDSPLGPPRQRTMDDTITWSYDLLNSSERKLFRRLSVFRGGWTADACGSVCYGLGDLDGDAIDGMTSLIDKSLLHRQVGPGGQSRFDMLEPIRQYAEKLLTDTEEDHVFRQRHADHYLALAEAGDPELRGRNQERWFDRLEWERPNMRAALEWSLGPSAHGDMAIRLAAALGYFFWIRGPLKEAQQWMRAALATRSGALRERAMVLAYAGRQYIHTGDYDTGIGHLRQSLQLAEKLNDYWCMGRTLAMIASALAHRGESEQALSLANESLNASRLAEDDWLIAIALNLLGELARLVDDYDSAAAHYRESLEVCRSIGDEQGISLVLFNRGSLELERERHEDAVAFFEEGLSMAVKIGDWSRVAGCVEALARVAVHDGQLERAARLLGAADRLRKSCDVPPVYLAYRADFDRMLASTREALGEALFAEMSGEGMRLSMEELISYALSGGGSQHAGD